MDDDKRTKEMVLAELAANNAEIAELQRLNALLMAELTDKYPVGWAVVTALSTSERRGTLHPVGQIGCTEFAWEHRLTAVKRGTVPWRLLVESIPADEKDWCSYGHRPIDFGEELFFPFEQGAQYSIRFFATEAEARAAIPAPEPVDNTPPA